MSCHICSMKQSNGNKQVSIKDSITYMGNVRQKGSSIHLVDNKSCGHPRPHRAIILWSRHWPGQLPCLQSLSLRSGHHCRPICSCFLFLHDNICSPRKCIGYQRLHAHPSFTTSQRNNWKCGGLHWYSRSPRLRDTASPHASLVIQLTYDVWNGQPITRWQV